MSVQTVDSFNVHPGSECKPQDDGWCWGTRGMTGHPQRQTGTGPAATEMLSDLAPGDETAERPTENIPSYNAVGTKLQRSKYTIVLAESS